VKCYKVKSKLKAACFLNSEMELLKSLNLFKELKCKILKLAKIFKIEIQNAKSSENLKKRKRQRLN